MLQRFCLWKWLAVGIALATVLAGSLAQNDEANPAKFCGRYKLEISVSVAYKKSTALKGGGTAQGKMRNLITQRDFCGNDLDTEPEV